MSLKKRKILIIIGVTVAICSVCYVMNAHGVTYDSTLTYVEHSINLVNWNSSSQRHAFEYRRSFSPPESDPLQGLPTHPCIDRMATNYGRVEDVFCTELGKFESKYKNPCFYDYHVNVTRKLRCLPYFYIIGSDKCGTTDLHSRLINHPHIMGNKGVIGKEASYWGWRHFGKMGKQRWYRNETTESYMNIFGMTAELLEAGGNQFTDVVTGDASPMDFYDFQGWRMTPQNWGKHEPEVLTPMLIRGLHRPHIPKLITQFRDPIERIFSLYIFLADGNSTEEFHRDVIESMEKLKRCTDERDRRSCFFDGPLYEEMPVKVHTGCYSVFLTEWLKAFPRSSIFITRLEDTSANMKQALKDIFTFLELDPLKEDVLDFISKKAKKHVTKDKVGMTMLPETAELLKAFYQPCNVELARMLQDDRYLWNDTPHQ